MVNLACIKLNVTRVCLRPSLEARLQGHVNIPANKSLPDTLPPSSHLPILTPVAPDTLILSSKESNKAAQAQITALSAPSAPTQSTGSAQRPGQRLSAHMSARCVTVLPCTETVMPSGALGRGEARRARSSTSRPAMRIEKRSGGAALRNRAL